MLRLFAVLLTAAPVAAASPQEELVEEIAELREQIGDRGEVVSDTDDFVDALRGVAQQAGHAEASDDRPPGPRRYDRYRAPRRQGRGNPESAPEPWGGPRRPPRPTPPLPPVRPHFGPGTERGFDGPPQPEPEVLLRESAFKLEQIAHRLELAEQFDQADAVREAAGHLRESARGGHDRDERELDEARRELERERDQLERGRREMEVSRRRMEEARRRLDEQRREGERRLRETTRRLEETQRRAKERLEQRRKRPREPRREASDRLVPPPGVHGGPIEPPSAEAE